MMIKRLLLSITALFLFSVSSLAAEPVLINQYKEWGYYSYAPNGSKSCFVLSLPTVLSPSTLNHGNVFFLAAQDGNGGFEPQLEVGYNLQANSDVTVQVGTDRFSMYTQNKRAWLKVKADESRLINAMRNGNSMTVSAISARGNPTSYTFSLSGVTAALRGASSC